MARFVFGKTRVTHATRLWPQVPTRVTGCQPPLAKTPKVLAVGDGIDVAGPCMLFHTSIGSLPWPGAEEIKE